MQKNVCLKFCNILSATKCKLSLSLTHRTTVLVQPNTKSRFRSKKNLNFEEKKYVDVRVFGGAEFKFNGLEMRLKRNYKN